MPISNTTRLPSSETPSLGKTMSRKKLEPTKFKTNLKCEELTLLADEELPQHNTNCQIKSGISHSKQELFTKHIGGIHLAASRHSKSSVQTQQAQQAQHFIK